MKILLDECIDPRMAKAIAGFEMKSVREMGWAGIKNGKLLKLAEQNFDVFITVDQGIPFQQNIKKFNLAIIVLKAGSTHIGDLLKLVPKLQTQLASATKGTVVVIS